MLVYVDTPILVKGIRGHDEQYCQHVDALLELSRNGECQCVTSEFAIMEALDTLQTYEFYVQEIEAGQLDVEAIFSRRRQRSLTEDRLVAVEGRVKEWLDARKQALYVRHAEEDPWELILLLCSYTNIHAPDCVHLAQALLLGCDVIASEDTHFTKCVRDELASDTQVTQRLDEVLLDLISTPFQPMSAEEIQRVVQLVSEGSAGSDAS